MLRKTDLRRRRFMPASRAAVPSLRPTGRSSDRGPRPSQPARAYDQVHLRARIRERGDDPLRNRREIFPRQQRDLLRLAAPAPILHPDLFALLPAAMHVPPVPPVTPEKPPLLVLRQFVAGELEGRERTLCIPRRAKLPAVEIAWQQTARQLR